MTVEVVERLVRADGELKNNDYLDVLLIPSA